MTTLRLELRRLDLENRLKTACRLGALGWWCILLCGCTAGAGFFNPKQSAAPPAAPVVTAPAPHPPPPQVPYAMSATLTSSCIEFTVTNHGTSDLAVSPYNFALIPQHTRQVIPYSPESGIVDVPATVKPGETVSGRAIFNEFSNPAGARLVFKPDATGTFAIVQAPGAALQGVY